MSAVPCLVSGAGRDALNTIVGQARDLLHSLDLVAERLLFPSSNLKEISEAG